MSSRTRPYVFALSLLALLHGLSAVASTPGERVNDIADRLYEARLALFPEIVYFVDVDADRHDGLFDNSIEAQAHWQQREDAFLAEVSAIDEATLRGTPQWITHGLMLESLESSVQSRICRAELWTVNQMGGWHQRYVRIAGLQPVATESERADALARWKKFPGFIANELANIQTGIAQGYSSPKPAVEKVIKQLDGVLALEVEQSPFTSPAQRSDDEAFKAEFNPLVADEIIPALRKYRDYLKDNYLGQAREQLSVTANPDGRACYQASLRGYTTLKRSPEAVFDLGEQTVNSHIRTVEKLGKGIYGVEAFKAVIQKVKEDEDNRFESKDEVLAFSRAMVSRTRSAMNDWFKNVPDQKVVVEPHPEFLDGAGVSSRYEAPKGDRPGTYRITLANPKEQTRGSAEITAVHEAWPGHHLQIAIAQNLEGLHPISRLSFNSGFAEGWARYSEGLAEEMGLYETETALITRRAWPARGMVVDPGIHVKGWTRDQAKAFLRESGRFEGSRADDMVNRIAILPGQLTAYDSGALEIFALRKLAEETLGDDFDIKTFHEKVLENGSIPLPMLRTHIEAWLDQVSE